MSTLISSMISLIFLTSILSTVHSVNQPNENARCDVEIQLRIPCGLSLINSTQCKTRNCCWDSNIKNTNRCFKSKAIKQGISNHAEFTEVELHSSTPSTNEEESIGRMCAVVQSDRLPCHRLSTSKDTCETNGCCFDPYSVTSPVCFQRGLFRINSHTKNILQCTRECSGVGWETVRDGYVRCTTDIACWTLLGGARQARCMDDCKKSIEIQPTEETREKEGTTSSTTQATSPPTPHRYAVLTPQFIQRLVHPHLNREEEVEE